MTKHRIKTIEAHNGKKKYGTQVQARTSLLNFILLSLLPGIGWAVLIILYLWEDQTEVYETYEEAYNQIREQITTEKTRIFLKAHAKQTKAENKTKKVTYQVIE